MTCATERQLVELATGDGDAATRTHVAGCDACAARLGALARDLTMLHTALSAEPVGVAVHRRVWVPFAAAAAMAAALFLFTVVPGRTPAPVSVATVETQSEFGEQLATALFAEATLDTSDGATEAWELETALSGGTLCGGGYTGDDCTVELALADYE
jgi:hypothetical protein